MTLSLKELQDKAKQLTILLSAGAQLSQAGLLSDEIYRGLHDLRHPTSDQASMALYQALLEEHPDKVVLLEWKFRFADTVEDLYSK